jgi:hypothetical protein
MPLKRYVLIPLALFGLLAFIALHLNPAAAQEPAGITLTPTEREQTATPTEIEITDTPTEPVITDTPTEPVIIDTPTPTGEITFPPPFVTDTPTPEDSRSKATRTPPVLPSTGQSPIDGGFPVEGLFAVVLLALVGWFLVRGVTGSRTQK